MVEKLSVAGRLNFVVMPPRSPRDVLQQTLGHAGFRGQQAAVIDRVLDGGHALVVAPTGAGKSLCYQIPALLLSETGVSKIPGAGVTLVLSPLIALMKDQVDALRAKGIAATYINSSLGRAERDRRYAGLAAGQYTLVYVTPERFRKPDFRAALDTAGVSLLAVDEAHCVSEWGHDFRPDYTRVDEFRQLLGHPTTIALTATATPEVQRDIITQLGLTPGTSPGQMSIFHEGIARPNLSLDVQTVWDDDDKLERILTLIENAPASGHTAGNDRAIPCGIVYFTLIKTLRAFSGQLRDRRVSHLNYHGDLDAAQRRGVQEDFMQDRCPLVLATNAFGMGIDKPDIRFVIHADLPGSLEAYTQEFGRAGRDGQPSACTLLYDQRDLATRMEFMRWANPDAEFYQRVFSLLEHDADRVHAEGLDWLRTQLHAKQGKHDRRLDTALAMLERFGTLASDSDWREDDHPKLRVVADLAPKLLDADRLAEKLQRDQQKLYALVQYANHDGDRQAFLNDYFGVENPNDS